MNFLFLLFAAFIVFRNEYQTIHLKDFRCVLNDEKLHGNSTCYTKPGRDNSTMLNFKVWSKRGLNSLNIKATLKYKYETTYREILHSPRVDWCRFINANTIANRLFWIAMDFIKGDDKTMMHPCPYFDLVHEDVRVPMNKMIAIFPPGEYRLIIRVADSDDEEILMVNATYAVLPSKNNKIE